MTGLRALFVASGSRRSFRPHDRGTARPSWALPELAVIHLRKQQF